ncbi:MAG: hypothetical protein J4473_03200 [Candidatus Aenigmarchaeota archaeon]|nr:hypothetical protein [Candidatus Aenigmarchaeota archaeon]
MSESNYDKFPCGMTGYRQGKLYKIIRNTFLGTALSLSLYASHAKADELVMDYNALETAVTTDGHIRNRVLTNLSLETGNMEIGYSGLNEVNNLNIETYFGRNCLTIGQNGQKTRLLIETRADKHGVFDTKAGIRNTGMVESIGCYGYLDTTANNRSAKVTLFCGKPVGKGISAEIFQSSEFSQHNHPVYYTELQLNHAISGRVDLFCRAEIPDFNANEAVYLFGITIKPGF